jgi:hypothetical protein
MTVMTVSPDDFTHKIDVLQFVRGLARGRHVTGGDLPAGTDRAASDAAHLFREHEGEHAAGGGRGRQLADHGWVATDLEGLGGHDPGA